jgi:hypothetical protein
MKQHPSRSLGLQSLYEESAIAVHKRFKHCAEATGQLAEWEAEDKRLREKFQRTRDFIKKYGQHTLTTNADGYYEEAIT